MDLPESVRIVEVGPRDGLQSQQRVYPLETKVKLVDLLVDAGFTTIEVTGLVKPDVIPQLADASELLAALERRPGVTYRALCPNHKGTLRAVDSQVDEVLGLITASDGYNVKNAGMTWRDNLDDLVRSAEIAREASIPMVVAIGMAMFCPYEGDTPPERIHEIVERLWAEGVTSYYLAISVGLDNPRAVYDLTASLKHRWPDSVLGLHIHNTNGMGLANALAGAQAGIEFFEGSICGIGGGIRMPYGMAPFGNVATEDLVHMFNECGVRTNLDTERVIAAARQARELLELEEPHSYALRGAVKSIVLEQGRTAPRVR